KDNLCIYSYLTMNDMKKIRATAGDTEDLINYLREHKDALIVILFREIGKNKIKINFRTKGNIDILPLARGYNGGGHKFACGALCSGNLKDVIKLIITDTENFIKKNVGLEYSRDQWYASYR
ncbi:MAG: DHHA1 domain-containing protein, partial [Candidatus Hydrogenedentota bacterium]